MTLLRLIGRVPSYQNPALACDDLVWPIEVQRLDGRPSDRSYADNEQPVSAPAEMVAPALRARMIQAHRFASLQITGLGSDALALITLSARTPEILALSLPANGHRKQMLDAQRAPSQTLVGTTIATAMARIGKHLGHKLHRDIGTAHARGTGNSLSGGGAWPRPFSSTKAWAFRTISASDSASSTVS